MKNAWQVVGSHQGQLSWLVQPADALASGTNPSALQTKGLFQKHAGNREAVTLAHNASFCWLTTQRTRDKKVFAKVSGTVGEPPDWRKRHHATGRTRRPWSPLSRSSAWARAPLWSLTGTSPYKLPVLLSQRFMLRDILATVLCFSNSIADFEVAVRGFRDSEPYTRILWPGYLQGSWKDADEVVKKL